MLKIEKNKILYFPYTTSKRYRNLTNIKGGIFLKMNDFVEMAENVTFGDFFKLLIKEQKHMDLIFAASLYGVPFGLLIKDFNRKTKPSDDEIRHLEIYWFVDFDDDGLSIESDLHGISRKENNDYDEIPFGLDFIPITELKNYPLKLNENLEIRDYSRVREVDNLVLRTTKKFTLYEIIHAILYELTWYGTPEKRDDEGQSILDEVRKIKTVDDVRKE